MAIAQATAWMPESGVKRLQHRCALFFRDRMLSERIVAEYCGHGRHYHTLEHLHELFEARSPVMKQSPHATALELAVWFHDIVYSTSAADYPRNEILSARALFRNCQQAAPHLLEGRGLEQVELAADMILCTRRHTLSRAPPEPARREAVAQFLDADLSILCAAPQRLWQYDRGIALEAGIGAGASLVDFGTRRLRALESFMGRGTLFFTPAFQARNAQAQGNLAMLAAFWRRASRGQLGPPELLAYLAGNPPMEPVL